jgi:hypothetical protein
VSGEAEMETFASFLWQGFQFASQALYQLSHAPALFFFFASVAFQVGS